MCQCKTIKGTLCKNKPLQGSVYCKVHQTCISKTSKKLKSKTVKSKTAKTTKVSTVKKTAKTMKKVSVDTRPGIRRSPIKDVGAGKYIAKYKPPVYPKTTGKIVKKASPEIVGYKNIVFKGKKTKSAPKTIVKAILTGNRDVDEKILLQLDPKSLIAFCKTNKTVNSFCKSNRRIKEAIDYYLLPLEAMKRLTKLKNEYKPLIKFKKPQKFLLHFIDEIVLDDDEVFYETGDIANYIFIENPWTHLEEDEGGLSVETFKEQIERSLKGIPFYYRDDSGFLDNFGDEEIGIVIGEKGKDVWRQYAKPVVINVPSDKEDEAE